jgi:hypothetical protein
MGLRYSMLAIERGSMLSIRRRNRAPKFHSLIRSAPPPIGRCVLATGT